MSYILDALRKSDQLRQRGAAPTLLLGQAAATVPNKPALLQYGLLALVLLATGIAIGWLRPWQPEPAAPAPTAVIAQAPETAQTQQAEQQPVIAPAPQPALTTRKNAQDSAPATQALPAPVAAVPPLTPRETVRVKPSKPPAPPKVVQAPKKAVEPPPESSPAGVPAGAPASPAPPAAMAMADLPLAIQQELPPMAISVHAYSGKPAERLVGINNRLLHEGQEVAPGLKLEQITPNGMILSFKGYTFRRGVH